MAHPISEPPKGAKTEQRDCPECGKTTVWYLRLTRGRAELGVASLSWQWLCSGQTSDELAQR